MKIVKITVVIIATLMLVACNAPNMLESSPPESTEAERLSAHESQDMMYPGGFVVMDVDEQDEKACEFDGISDLTSAGNSTHVTPFSFTVAKSIHSDLPEFEFRIEGVQKEKESGDHTWATVNISKLIISGHDGYSGQEFTFPPTSNDAILREEFMYGLTFGDWNFDGYLDVSLRKHRGGSMGNVPRHVWLWNSATQQFEENSQLEEISEFTTISINTEKRLISSAFRASTIEYAIDYYKYRDGIFVMVRSEMKLIDYERSDQGRPVLRTVIEELIDGEMTIVYERFDDLGNH